MGSGKGDEQRGIDKENPPTRKSQRLSHAPLDEHRCDEALHESRTEMAGRMTVYFFGHPAKAPNVRGGVYNICVYICSYF